MRNIIAYLESAIATIGFAAIAMFLVIVGGIIMLLAMMADRVFHPKASRPVPDWLILGLSALLAAVGTIIAYLMGNHFVAATGAVVCVLTIPCAVYDAFRDATGQLVVAQGEDAFQ